MMRVVLPRRIGWWWARPAPSPDGARPGPGLPRMLGAFLWLGLISYGGKGPPYQFDELVRRRRWLTEDDYAQAYALAKLLPGPTGVSTALFLALRLGNRLQWAVLCLIPYFVPGVLIILGLTILVFGQERPPWAAGALAGLSIGATALVLTTGLRLAPTARRARGGLPVIALAGGASLLGVPLPVVLIPLVLLGVWLNRPSREAGGG